MRRRNPIGLLAAMAAYARFHIEVRRGKSFETISDMPGFLGDCTYVPTRNEKSMRRAFSTHNQTLLG
jgi:hypothetical protein